MAGARAVGRRRLPPLRHVRHAVRLHRGHGGDARRRASTGTATSGRWQASATRRARKSAFGGSRSATSSRSATRAALKTATAISSRATPRPAWPSVPMVGAVRRAAAAGRRAIGPARPGSSRWRARRSTSRPAARCPTPDGCSAPRPAASAIVEGISRIGPGLPRAHQRARRGGHAARRRHRHRGSRRRRCATPPGAITRRRTCCMRRCGRCSARTSSRRGRSSRPIVCGSTSSTSSRSRATSSIASSGSSTSRSSRTRPVETEVRPTAGSDRRPARWRSSARSTATRCASCRVPGFSMELCGGTHVRGHRRHRLFRDRLGKRRRGRRPPHRGGRPGSARVQWAQQQRAALQPDRRRAARQRDQAVEAIEKLQGETKRLTREVSQLKTKVALGGGGAAARRTTPSRSRA